MNENAAGIDSDQTVLILASFALAKPGPAIGAVAVEIDPKVPLDFHPLANVFPLMEGAEFNDLVADIGANGQREDIVLLDGKVLDGRNRYRACLAAGIAPRAVAFSPDVHGESMAFVISKNLKRRRGGAPRPRGATRIMLVQLTACLTILDTNFDVRRENSSL